MIGVTVGTSDPLSVCQTCGACCAFSREWPRFTLEDDAALDRIPRDLVDDGGGRMRCHGDRCAALMGEVGVATSCAIYDVRPEVCRECQPGDEACQMARRHFGLPRDEAFGGRATDPAVAGFLEAID